MMKHRRPLESGETLGRLVKFDDETHPMPWTMTREPLSLADRTNMAREWLEEYHREPLGPPPKGSTPPSLEDVLEDSIPKVYYVIRDATGHPMVSRDKARDAAAILYAGCVALPDDIIDECGGTLRTWLETRVLCIPSVLSLATQFALPREVWESGFRNFGKKLQEAVMMWRKIKGIDPKTTPTD